MPALVLFGRRSRVGSDDLYCPALFLIMYQLPLLVVSVFYTSFWRRCSTMTFDDDGFPFWFMLGAIPINGFMACIYLMMMHISAKGTIVDHERRMLMPRVLHVFIVWATVMFAYGTMGLVFWYNRPICYPDSNFVLAIAGCMVAEVSFTSTLGACMLFGAPLHEIEDLLDRSGHENEIERQSLLDELERSIPNSDVYVPHHTQHWERRCRSCCACIRCFTCNLFGGAGTQHDSMSVVAKVFARLFYGSPDLVISDIVAGFILLAAVQAHEESVELEKQLLEVDEDEETLSDIRARLHASTGIDDEHNRYMSIRVASPTTNSESHLLHPPKSSLTSLQTQEQYDEILAATVQELAHFSKYAIGIYGWMLYVWSHPWGGTFRLAFTCMKRDVKQIHGDNFFHTGQAALQLETGVATDNIVYASFNNSVYKPAYCVVLDNQRKEVVIAIRGTLSLEDCLTDAIAYGMSLDGVAERYGCDGTGEFAHQGFLHCAEAIYLEIERLGILEMLFNPHSTDAIDPDMVNECERGQYRDYTLIITGHSLGASTAVLLSLMLRPKYPNLHCFAFSPPGCTMSPALAARCSDFVTSIVVGHDIVARSSLKNAEDLRDQVIDLIGRSKVGKSAILRQIVAWRKPNELLYEEFKDEATAFSRQLANYRTMLQRIQQSEPIHHLTIPGKLIHLKRAIKIQEPGGCWVCCRPGGGVCCTVRTNYEFSWSSADQFKSIRIARSMLDDHFPDKVHHVLQDCAKRIKPRDQHWLG